MQARPCTAILIITLAFSACQENPVDVQSEPTAAFMKGGNGKGGGGDDGDDGGGGGGPASPAIAYVVRPGNVPEVRVIDADGGHEATIFKGPKFGIISRPSWSPSGSGSSIGSIGSIAFTGPTSDLVLIDVVLIGGEPQVQHERLLVTRCGCFPAWSSDASGPLGDVIAYAEGVPLPSRLRTIPADGPATSPPGGDEAATTIYSDPDFALRWPAWNPDATEIAFVLRNSEDISQTAIMVVDVRSPPAFVTRTVLHMGELSGIAQLDWSRDGTTLAFDARPLGDESAARRIYLLVLDGGSAPTELVTGSSPSWSPLDSDDSEIVFTDSRGAVVAIEVNTGVVRKVARVGSGPDWNR